MSLLCACLMLSVFVASALPCPATIFNIYSSTDHKHAANKFECNSPGVIAFSVGRKARFEPSSTSRIQMDHAFFNKGGYFKMQTSTFTAPVSGVYSFHFGGTGKRGKMVNLRMYAGKPEKVVAATYNDNRSRGQASGSVIIEMKKDDQASLWLYGGHALDEYTPPTTYFNGYLVSETKDN